MSPPPDGEIASRLSAILRSDEFHKRVSDYLQEWLDRWLPGALHWLRTLPPGTRWLLFGVCALLLGAIGVQLYLGLRTESAPVGWRRGARASLEVGEEPEALLARARALSELGRWREAARALQQSALLRLSRAQGLPWRPELADWEWVACLPEVPGLAEFTRAAQRLAYGPDPDASGYAACEALHRRLVA